MVLRFSLLTRTMWLLLFVAVVNLALGFAAAMFLGHGPDWLDRYLRPADKPHANA